MRRSAALFPIAFALGATGLVPEASAREPTMIKACGTISQPGSYELANNLTAATGDCLVITADFVTIDLAGFSISGSVTGKGAGILAAPSSGQLKGIAIRDGSISGFVAGVDLRSATDSIVEGLRVFARGGDPFNGVGIAASGIVKGNIVGYNGDGGGIGATGIITGNIVTDSGPRTVGIGAGPGSTVIGNTANNNRPIGIVVQCPSNVIDNTAINNLANIELRGEGCNSANNVGP